MMWLATSSPTWRGGLGAGLDGRPHAAHVAADDGGHQSAADLHPFDDLHVGRLGHRVGRFDQGHEPLGFQIVQWRLA